MALMLISMEYWDWYPLFRYLNVYKNHTQTFQVFIRIFYYFTFWICAQIIALSFWINLFFFFTFAHCYKVTNPSHYFSDSFMISFIYCVLGTHDSMTYSITQSSPVAPDSEEVVKLVSKYFCCTKKIIYKWCITQNATVLHQLNMGIR